MNIEQEIFDRWKANEYRLRQFGFDEENGVLTYRRDLPDYGFEITVRYDGQFSGTVMDHDIEEEYTNYRLEIPGKFSALVKEEFIKCLEVIRNSCCEKVRYRNEQAERIIRHVQEKYDSQPEYLWEKLPDISVYRNRDNKKWYLLHSAMVRNKIDSYSDSGQEVDIINIRVQNSELDNLLKTEGIYKAYHMNKKNWVTITLDDTLDDETIESLIADSYQIISESK